MGIKLYDGLSSTVARSLATSDPAVTVRLDDAAPPAADTVFIADGVGAGTWGAPPAGELPEILAAIALADPPTTAGQAPTYDGTGVTWAAPSGGGALTGNPMIDAPGSAVVFADEFDSGSPDLAARGWTVYNESTGQPMTRAGDCTFGSQSDLTTATTYQSTLVGSVLLIQTPSSAAVTITRAPANNDYHTYACKFGIHPSKVGVYLGISNQAPGGALFHSGDGVEWDQAAVSEDTPPLYYYPIRRSGSNDGSRLVASTILGFATDIIVLNRINGVGNASVDYNSSAQMNTNHSFVGAAPLGTVGAFGIRIASGANRGAVFLDYFRVMERNWYFNT